MRYPFVLLDAGETLLSPRRSYGAIYARVLATLGVDRPVEAFDRALRATWDEMERAVPIGADRYSHYPGGEEEFWHRFVRSALDRVDTGGLHGDLASRALGPLREAFARADAWRVYPEVRGVIERLRRDGARIAVVSNWDSRLPLLLRRVGLENRLDAVVVSALEGREKPDPAPFRAALARVGGRPERAIHVGDTPAADIEGSRAAGIRGILIDRARRFPEGEDVIADLTALPAIARGEGAGRA